MMQRIKQFFAAGQVVELAIPGRFFRFDSGFIGFNVEFFRNGASIGSIEDMQAGSWAKLDQAFDMVRIVNGGSASAVSLMIGTGESGVDRIVGEVSVQDSSLTRSLMGQAFFVQMAVSPSAGKFAQSQLWNPVNSKFNIVVRKIIAKVLSSTGNHFIGVSNAVLDGGTEVPSWIKPKTLLNPTAPACKCYSRIDSDVALPAGYFYQMFKHSLASQELGVAEYVVRGMEELVIPPGRGLTFYIDTADIYNRTVIDFYQDFVQ